VIKSVSKDCKQLLVMGHGERDIHPGRAYYRQGEYSGLTECREDTMQDHSDWKLNSYVFNGINLLYGPFQVYLFAPR
jgi:hypothetical protein